MNEPAQKSPFARLDTSLMRPTKPENHLSRIPESQNTGNTENQKDGKPESQNTGKMANQKTVKRATYPKITYRICPEALNAIEDTKHILKREYQIKANLEEIAEEAIIKAYHDLLENQKASNLVIQLSRKPESQ